MFFESVNGLCICATQQYTHFPRRNRRNCHYGMHLALWVFCVFPIQYRNLQLHIRALSMIFRKSSPSPFFVLVLQLVRDADAYEAESSGARPAYLHEVAVLRPLAVGDLLFAVRCEWVFACHEAAASAAGSGDEAQQDEEEGQRPPPHHPTPTLHLSSSPDANVGGVGGGGERGVWRGRALLSFFAPPSVGGSIINDDDGRVFVSNRGSRRCVGCVDWASSRAIGRVGSVAGEAHGGHEGFGKERHCQSGY